MTDCLDQAEAIDHYRAACARNAWNAASRANQVYELATIEPKTAAAVQEIATTLPFLSECAAEFAILDSSADGGMPHTRPPALICLPAAFCKSVHTTPEEFKITLIHEAIHVHQRKNADLWKRALAHVGWAPISAVKIPEELRERCRINPDTIATPFWAWQGRHVPLPLFPKERQGGPLSAVPIMWLDLQTGAVFPGPPTAFSAIHKETGAALEHPYELYAERLSRKPQRFLLREPLAERLLE